jgi:hypothetical protein
MCVHNVRLSCYSTHLHDCKGDKVLDKVLPSARPRAARLIGDFDMAPQLILEGQYTTRRTGALNEYFFFGMESK